MSQDAVAASQARLSHFPIAFFSVILGMAGFTIAWGKAELLLAVPPLIGGILLPFTIILLYLGKMARHWGT